MHHRVDWDRLCAALEMACEIRACTLAEAAYAIGVSPSTLTRMRQGRTLSADALAGLVAWLYPQQIPRWIREVP
jgi:hypothetical protein